MALLLLPVHLYQGAANLGGQYRSRDPPGEKSAHRSILASPAPAAGWRATIAVRAAAMAAARATAGQAALREPAHR